MTHHRRVVVRRDRALCVSAVAACCATICAGWSPARAQVEPYVIEELVSDTRYESDGSSESLTRMRAFVATKEGRQALEQLSLPFREGSSQVRFNYVRTLKSSGDIIETSGDTAIDVAPRIDEGLPGASGVKLKTVLVSGLEVGDRLEYEAVTSTAGSARGRDFWGSHSLPQPVRVLAQRVTLDLPADREVLMKTDPLRPPDVE